MSTRHEVSLIAANLKGLGYRIGLASGAFDLLHAGHLSYLSEFKKRVDILYVAVMSDERCRAKGEGRPVIPEEHRRAMVGALAFVADAFIFSEHGDEANLRAIMPHEFARGDGHTEDMFEKAVLDELGVTVVLIHTPRIESTTAIIERIRA